MEIVEVSSQPLLDEALRLVKRVHRGLDELSDKWWHGLRLLALVDHGKVRAVTGIRSLPGLLEARPFTALPGDTASAKALGKHIANLAKHVRVVALSTPHHDAGLREAGFKPVRRILRIDIPTYKASTYTIEDYRVAVVKENIVDDAARAFVEGLATHWDWWIRNDIGGFDKAIELTKHWVTSGGSRWFVALKGNEVVGATGYRVWRGTRAWFAGVAVKPSHRLKGVGRLLLYTALRDAAEKGYSTLTVYTVASISSLAPGALLYLKAGGFIRAEYVHYEKP